MTQQNTNQALCDTQDALMQLGFELSTAINIGRDTTRLRYIEDRLKHVVETLEQNIEPWRTKNDLRTR